MMTQRLFLSFLFLLFFSGRLLAASAEVEVFKAYPRPFTPIDLEHAVSQNEIMWGLMQRPSLPWNKGMTFNYKKPQTIDMWMFNTLIDLSVAFLDENRVIRSIEELNSYPDMVDPSRPVRSAADLKRYPYNDPLIMFFRARTVSSAPDTQYALEMNGGWFKANDVNVGDVVLWDVKKPYGFILHTFDIEPFLPKNALFSLIEFKEESPYAVWLPNEGKDRDVAFLDSNHNIVKQGTLKGGGPYSLPAKPVIYSVNKAKYLFTAPPGWLKNNKVPLPL